ncbi:hypothetical protein [Carboxylicivirga sp. RSCT41]|uniref:hypothetical protein n=1 Tax=Carboxylicivirga agarovorans TaxID=3417570 RepID=UPI003D335286
MKEISKDYKKVPADIILSIVLSSVISAFWFVIYSYYRDTIYENLMQYTGWSPDSIYGGLWFLLILFTGAIMYNRKYYSQYVLMSRGYILIMLILSLYFGLRDWIISSPELLVSDNPYLKFSPYRPLYTVLLPLIWAIYISYHAYLDFARNRKPSQA